MPKTIQLINAQYKSGSTFVGCALLTAASHLGFQTIALKPIDTLDPDCESDADRLSRFVSVDLPKSQISPVILDQAAEPIIACEQSNQFIRSADLAGKIRGALLREHDFSIVEGVGCWMTPISRRELASAINLSLKLPVVLVVDLRPNCLNEALMAARVIQQDGAQIVGWIANQSQPDHHDASDLLVPLRAMIRAPMLAQLNYSPAQSASKAAAAFDLNALKSWVKA